MFKNASSRYRIMKKVATQVSKRFRTGLKLCFDLRPKCCPKALKSAEKSPILKPSESSISGKKQPKPAKNCRKILVLMFHAVKSWKLLQILHKKWWFVTFSFKLRLSSWKTGQNRLYSRKKLGSTSASLRKFFAGFLKVLPSAAQNVLPNVNGGSKSLRPDSVIFAAKKKPKKATAPRRGRLRRTV